jgi:hypothetical protein
MLVMQHFEFKMKKRRQMELKAKLDKFWDQYFED